MRPWLQKSASIQPRTSPGKSDAADADPQATLAPVLGIHLPKNRGFSFPGVLERVHSLFGYVGKGYVGCEDLH